MNTPIEKRARLAARELSRRLRDSNTSKQFGFELEAVGEGRAVLKMRVAERHKQVHGVVHGGILAALADTAGGLATYLVVPPGTRVATVEMKINYLEPVAGGIVIAEAKVLRRGKNLAIVDCDLRDEKERLVSKALMTFSIGPTKRKGRRD